MPKCGSPLEYVDREDARILAAVGRGGGESDAAALLAYLALDETLAVVRDLDGIDDRAALVEELDLHILDEGLGKMDLGEIEGTVMESSLSVHKAIRADGLAVKIGVEDEADALYVLFLCKLDLYGSANGSNPGILLVSDGSVVAVNKLGDVALGRGHSGGGHDLRHLHLKARQIAIVLHKSLLKLAELLLVDAARRETVLGRNCRRSTHSLTEKSAGRHNAGSTHHRKAFIKIPDFDIKASKKQHRTKRSGNQRKQKRYAKSHFNI